MRTSPFSTGAGDVGNGVDPVRRVVVGGELTEANDAALGAGGDFDDVAFGVLGGDRFARRPEVEAVDGLVVLAHVVVALGRARRAGLPVHYPDQPYNVINDLPKLTALKTELRELYGGK